MHGVDIDPVHRRPDAVLNDLQAILLQVRQDPLQELALLPARPGRCLHKFQARREQVLQRGRHTAVALILDCYGVMDQGRIAGLLLSALV